MLNYKEIICLRDKLENNEITIEIAKARYWNDFKDGQRSWHSKDWKERRSEFIENNCEICNSTETLTLQHLSHPRKYSDYIAEVTRTYTQEYIGINPDVEKSKLSNHIQNNYDYIPVPLCPNCKNRNPNKRVRKEPEYLCTECRHEFQDTIYNSIDDLISIFYNNEEAVEVRDKCFVSKDKWKNKHNLSSVRYWMQREQAKNNDAETIEKEAFLLYLKDSIKYLSFSDTITACKKCAYNFDVNSMELCPQCKLYYKGFQYPTCIQCLPADKQKNTLDKIKFAKEFQDIHKELGID